VTYLADSSNKTKESYAVFLCNNKPFIITTQNSNKIMYTTILVACISAIAAIGIYMAVTNLVTKNSIRKRREAALKEAEAEGETGTVIINLCDAGGYRQFSNSKHPIKAPADLKGLKMRTNGMKTIDMTFQAMGATTTTIPYSDLYMGLKTGVADGQENPWVNVEGMKFYEVQKYFTEVNYQFHPDPFYVNAAWWNGLPEEYRDIITECATKMGEYNDELIDKNSSAAKQTIVDSGCEVYEPSADELKAFQTAVQSVYDQCVTEGICTADEIKEMQDIVAKA